ncbi:MAG: hypothetical protein ACREUL_16770 [Steroidobacteraceae bacterium]
MSRAYSEAIKHHCPNATLVIDRHQRAHRGGR